MPLETDAEIRALLEAARTIAVFGASDKPDRASYGVMAALQHHGWRTLPVNPQITGEHLLGEYVWRDLAQIDVAIDIVDIFRRSDQVADAIDQAIAARSKAVWLQLGIRDDDAVARAEAAGLKVVQNRCIKVEAARLGVKAP